MANLAAKYRPKTFNEVVGQDIVAQILQKICTTEPLTIRNFLLIGPAGCGKTSQARLLARLLNGEDYEPIEVDAASHGGVESIRDIVDQARSYPIGYKYKVFIIDECFPGNTWVSTPSGKIQIKDIRPGDTVYNLTGQATVSRVFHNRVKPANLISLRVGNNSIITTQDHLFFTDEGWVKAKDLKEGDKLYDHTTMQSMRKSIRSAVSERHKADMQQGVSKDIYVKESSRVAYKLISKNMSNMWHRLLDSEKCKCNHMLNAVWNSLQEAESKYGEEIGSTCKTLAYIYMSGMWRAERDQEQRSSNNLLFSMCFEDSIEAQSEESRCSQAVHMVWEYIYSELRSSCTENMQQGLQSCTDNILSDRLAQSGIISSNEAAQPYVGSSGSSQDGRNQTEEWDITLGACDSWWERATYSAADSSESTVGGLVEARVSCEDWSEAGKQSESLSYELQVRPSVSRITSGDRGGWCRPQYEISTIARREESGVLEQFRVDSVEIYQPGNNDELFSNSFTSEELNGPYVDMYDLEIEGHPSYFVNEVLVHNCHSISSAGFQVLLKTLEESPAAAVFVLCTTNPEKIPATILSRVQTFQIKKISLDNIMARLKYIVEQENSEGQSITYEDDALNYVAKLGNGGMRDSITLLEKCISYNKAITSENVEKALNLPNYDDYFALLNAIARKDNKSIVEIIHTVYNSGINFVKFFEGFLSFVSNIVKYIYMKDINTTMIPSHYQDKIAGYGTAHAALCLKLSNKLVKMNQELKTTQYLQELAISYLCAAPTTGK